jgi:hypothetical protein
MVQGFIMLSSEIVSLVLLCHLALLDVILWITLVARLSKLVLHQETKIESWALAKRQSNISTRTDDRRES